ncbi:YufK family protein [Bacillus haynesii]|uniref:YufK family protein n=1 Tax=Bacillus haynesii TaxID=1925021 RepID=A0AA90E9J9_9BACI|nr:YufK family protein [Bacillus haynesii]MCY7752875.1 YufK family protein [Bacillus haynesii]MCY7790405.1 YufK family protein [Bacillus haynesii]MCY7847112.1 YufK family protein [Bacillus haynesii]MCY7862772.1 YufK family protein [Bacillus haynesii]MCY7999328.1 YufK family protein [Bacillus haynesii]
MKNTYVTGFFPFIAILLFSSSLAISSVIYAMEMLSSLGIYKGMLEFFSESGIRMALFVVFTLIFFMVFSALKLIANTVTELALLFFAKDPEGTNLRKIRIGSAVYLGASLLSFIFVQYAAGIAALFLLATLVYFIFIVYAIHSTLSFMSLIGFIMFELLFWFTFVIGTVYIIIKLYNSVMASLPV